MKTIHAQQEVVIPPKVTASVNNVVVKITGPRGTLKRNFGHGHLQISMLGNKRLLVQKWFGNKKTTGLGPYRMQSHPKYDQRSDPWFQIQDEKRLPSFSHQHSYPEWR